MQVQLVKDRDEVHCTRVVLNAMTGVLIRNIGGDTDAEEKPCEEGGRDGRDATTSPGTPGAPEPGRMRKDPLLEPQKGA